jgi:hypothetical protein
MLTTKPIRTSKTLIRVLPFIGALFLVGFSPAFATTNLVVNGNFAEPGTGCHAGTTDVPGWTVVSGNVDFESTACSGLNSKNGEVYFLDLTGSFAPAENDVGTISQTIKTVEGQKYTLSFYFGGNPQWQTLPYPNDSPLKAMVVYVDGSISGVYSVLTTGSIYSEWSYKKITFVAKTTSTTITFESLNGSKSNPSDFGPLLSNVALEAT